jgi:hypothetical protein
LDIVVHIPARTPSFQVLSTYISIETEDPAVVSDQSGEVFMPW